MYKFMIYHRTNTDVTEAGSSNDDDNVVSMIDVLAEDLEYEEDANRVLGASDPDHCTYEKVINNFAIMVL